MMPVFLPRQLQAAHTSHPVSLVKAPASSLATEQAGSTSHSPQDLAEDGTHKSPRGTVEDLLLSLHQKLDGQRREIQNLNFQLESQAKSRVCTIQ